MRKGPQAVRRDAASRSPRALVALLIAAALVVSGVIVSGIWSAASLPMLQASAPALHASLPQVEPAAAEGDATASALEATPTPPAGATQSGWIRVPKPKMPDGPRRVGLQAGHWLTEEAPPELGRILTQTGASWRGVNERELNLAIAEKIAATLRAKGIVVDVLPTTVPPGYLADAFVSLHGDSDGEGSKTGFKLAHSSRRTPYEDALQALITEEYGAATGLPYDHAGVSRNMLFYYAHSWTRIRYSTSPFTPSVILEMGFVSNDHDRDLMMYEQDLLAEALATAIVRFLDAHPREKLFGQDLLVPPFRSFASPSPTARP